MYMEKIFRAFEWLLFPNIPDTHSVGSLNSAYMSYSNADFQVNFVLK